MSPDSPVMAQFHRSKLRSGTFLVGCLLGFIAGIACLRCLASLGLFREQSEIEWRTFSDGAEIDETKRRGDVLSEALKKYRADNGKYPAKLTDLVPKYTPSILLPTAGRREWEYWSYENDFGLKFGVYGFYPCFYWTSYDDSWQGDS